MATTQYIGARYVPLFADPAEWNSTRTYEPLTIALHEGNSYTSRQYVPKGVDISNDKYWVLTGNYNAQVEQYRKEVEAETERAKNAEEAETERAKNAEEAETERAKNAEEAETERAKNAEQSIDANRARTFNTALDMKKSANLKAGVICATNGFHKIGDNGAAYYVIAENKTANEMDVLSIADSNLCAVLTVLEPIVNPEMFGAYGDDANDDTDSVNKAVSYALESKSILKVTGMYAITEPIKITDAIVIKGINTVNCGFHKTTNNKAAITDEIDAVFLIDGNTHSNGIEGKYSYHHEFENFCIKGCTNSYTADKKDADLQYGFYSKNGILKSHIYNCNMKSLDVGLYSPEFWNSELKNCRNISSYYTAVNISKECQGSVIVGNNTTSTHVCGFNVGALSYGDFSANLVEWVYGGIAYKFTSCSGNLLNNGYELGSGVAEGFYILNSKVLISGSYMGATLDNGVNLHVQNSKLELINSSIGVYGDSTDKNYKLFSTLDSVIKVRNVVNNGGNFLIESTIKNTYLNFNGCVFDTKYGRNGFNDISYSNDYDNNVWNIPSMAPQKTLRTGLTSYVSSYDRNLEWTSAIPKGSLSLNDCAASTGTVGWLTNMDNSSVYTSKGTITNVNDSTITMSNLFIDNYGTRFYKNLTIIGNTSNATGTITSINKDGSLNLSNVSGTFTVGETVNTKARSQIRSGDYIGIMSILTGCTSLRPESAVAGAMYFDTTLLKPVWYTGSKWVDATGNAV